MGLRAYFLLNVKNGVRRDDLLNGLLELEELPGVDYVEPVAGAYDIVVMVEAPDGVKEVAGRIENRSWVDKLTILRVVNLFDHRPTHACATQPEEVQ